MSGGWTAVVPIKPAPDRKSRLRPLLSDPARVTLSDLMLAHVLAVLARCDAVGELAVLSASPPEGWRGSWIADRGLGLNRELGLVAEAVPHRLLVLHADLAALGPGDVAALAQAAENGVAIAPDRHLRGTNALAAARSPDLRFAFGADSFARHRALMPEHRVVRRPGLGLDVDVGPDLEQAVRLGCVPALPDLPA